MRRLAIVLAAAVAACFGAGPIPSAPTDATIVFSIAPSTDPNSCLSYYIGDVAIGSDAGYAITIPYKPQSCGGGGSISQGVPQPVFRFAKTGGGSSMVGSAGPATGNSEPKIAVTGAGPAWAYPISTQSNQLQIDPAGTMINFGAPVGPTFAASALVGVADTLYLAASSPLGINPPNDPSYPCCGGMQGGGGGAGAIQTIPSSALHITPTLACSATSHCLAVNTDSVYYFDQPSGTSGSTTAVEQTSKDGVTSKIGDIGLSSGLTTPVGVAADDVNVVWATSVSFTGTSNNLPRGCALTKHQPGMMTPLFSTQQFSCSDVALDRTHAYFTIVSINGNDSNNQTMRGDGIGRVDLASGIVETLALGITGPQSGPRRVYVDGDDLYLVDPEVIGKIAKTSLEGRHDFEP